MISNILVPKHELISPEEAEKILQRYSATREDLPKIRVDDPAITGLEPKNGDIIRITRKKPTGGDSFYYRVVV